MAVTGDKTEFIKFGAAADALDRKMIVKAIRWVKPTTGGHGLEVTDTAGNIILEASANGANVTMEFDMHCAPVHGIIVTTLESGTLTVQVG